MSRLKVPDGNTDKSVSAGSNSYVTRDGHVEVTDTKDIADLKSRGFTDAAAQPEKPAQPRK